MSKLRVRTMRDKYGSRYCVVFRDGEGIYKPVSVMTEVEFQQLVDMFYQEQAEMDKLVTGKK